jgi:hypothetical protein
VTASSASGAVGQARRWAVGRHYGRLLRLAKNLGWRALDRARFETLLALSPVVQALDCVRDRDVTYWKADRARLNALFPIARRVAVIRAIRDSLQESDRLSYFHNVSRYAWRHRQLPRGVLALDDLFPPNLAVLDFLARSVAYPEREVLLDFPCGIGVLLLYAHDLGLTQIHGFDNWNYLERSTAERFLRRCGLSDAVLASRETLSSLPVTILSCVGFPLTMLMAQSEVWAAPSLRYVLADRKGRPKVLPGFRRRIEYAGLLTVFERCA